MTDPQAPRENATDAAVPVTDAAPAPVTGGVVTATVRRSPKYTVFLLIGAAFGVLLALILTFAFNGSQTPSESGFLYSQGQIFGFLMLMCIPAGLALFGVLALVLDRASRRRTRELSVAREHFRDDQ